MVGGFFCSVFKHFGGHEICSLTLFVLLLFDFPAASLAMYSAACVDYFGKVNRHGLDEPQRGDISLELYGI